MRLVQFAPVLNTDGPYGVPAVVLRVLVAGHLGLYRFVHARGLTYTADGVAAAVGVDVCGVGGHECRGESDAIVEASGKRWIRCRHVRG